jgi:hypothetical protein
MAIVDEFDINGGLVYHKASGFGDPEERDA